MAYQPLKLTVTLETVTPLFLGGAEPRGKPELRAPSFRGALRYWWRTWHTARRAGLSRDELYAAESAIFGNTEAASPLIVRLQGQPAMATLERPEQPAGLNYLMYGMHEREKRQGKTVLRYRPAIKPGERFDLILGARPTQNADEVLRQAAIALWLLCNLGGIGARVRRGAGALRALEVTGDWPDDLPPLNLWASSPEELSHRLRESLKHLVGNVDKVKGSAIPSLHPDLCIIGVFGKRWSSWEKALEEVGQAFQRFRNRYRMDRPDSDYHAVREFILTGKATETVKRAAFGLPLSFYYRSLQKEYEKQGYGRKIARKMASAQIRGQSPDGQETLDRSASPLRFRVVRLADGSYAILLLVFIVPLLPDGSRLRLTSRGRTASAKVPGQGIIADFLKHAQRQIAPLLEVKYR